MHNPANLPYPSQNLLSISHFCVFLQTDKNNNMYVPSTQSKNQTTGLQLDVWEITNWIVAPNKLREVCVGKMYKNIYKFKIYIFYSLSH